MYACCIQEAFWRIPGELDPDELTALGEGLQLNDDNEPINCDKIKVHAASDKQKHKKKEKKKRPEEVKVDKRESKAPSKAKLLKDLMKKRKANKKKRQR